jgi:diguanylate cyclase (GGDEF)-like protein
MDAGRNRGLPEQLRRERLLDMERRLVKWRRAAFAVLAVALVACAPWYGLWWLIPLSVALVAFAVADRFLEQSPHPARWMAAGWAIAPVMIAVSVALTGAADSPAIPWFALPAATLAARFEFRGVAFGVLFIVALMMGSTLAIEPRVVGEDPAFLIFPLAMVMGIVILSAAVVQSDREHRRDVVIDPLTGLLNRVALAQRVSELEQQAARGAGNVSVGMLVGDLDHFKQVNDEHGHAVGDAALKATSYAMRKALRAFDLIYRIGGEEFVVLLPGADLHACGTVAERLRAEVEHCSRPGLQLSISFGAAVCDSGGIDFDELFERADRALYEAKGAGRNRVQLADDGVELSDLTPVTHEPVPA